MILAVFIYPDYEPFGRVTALSEDGEWLLAGVPQAPYDAGRGGECRLYRYVAPEYVSCKVMTESGMDSRSALSSAPTNVGAIHSAARPVSRDCSTVAIVSRIIIRRRCTSTISWTAHGRGRYACRM